MGVIKTIMINTFREAVRDKIFYILLFFGVVLVLFSLVLSNLTLSEPVKIIKDFGLASISLGGVLVAVFVGISMVQKEVDKRTIYVILSKPVKRWQFLAGKYFGLLLTISVLVLIMTILLFVLCFIHEPVVPFELLYAIVAIFFELMVIVAFALFFSVFATSFLSGMFTLSIFIIGHLTKDLKALADATENIVFQKTALVLFYVFPNLENLNYKAQVVHKLGINLNEFLISLLYSVCYCLAVIFASVYIFNRKDIK